MQKANKQPKILLVDDDDGNLMILEAKLKERGYRVFCTQEPGEALSLAKRDRPDLIILDIIMPGMDGTELAQQFKQEPSLKEVPIFFVTCLQSKEEEAKPGFVVGRRIFAKPVDMDKLDGAIREIFGK